LKHREDTDATAVTVAVPSTVRPRSRPDRGKRNAAATPIATSTTGTVRWPYDQKKIPSAIKQPARMEIPATRSSAVAPSHDHPAQPITGPATSETASQNRNVWAISALPSRLPIQ
jgi:hypothetical protein